MPLIFIKKLILSILYYMFIDKGIFSGNKVFWRFVRIWKIKKYLGILVLSIGKFYAFFNQIHFVLCKRCFLVLAGFSKAANTYEAFISLFCFFLLAWFSISQWQMINMKIPYRRIFFLFLFQGWLLQGFRTHCVEKIDSLFINKINFRFYDIIG